MPPPHEKLADSLSALQGLQKAGHKVIHSRELSRTHRERLVAKVHSELSQKLDRRTAPEMARPLGSVAHSLGTNGDRRARR